MSLHTISGLNHVANLHTQVHIASQRRRVSETITREMRRRTAVEPVIGHAKGEHRMGRNHLAQ